MSITLAELAREVGGTTQDCQGILVSGANTIRDAVAGDITFAETPSHMAQLSLCKATAVLVQPGESVPEPMVAVEVEDVASSFRKIVAHFRPRRQHVRVGISPQASVSPTATIAENVDIYHGATVGDHVTIESGSVLHPGVHVMEGSKIGTKCELFPNVVIYDHTVIENNVTIHAGAVIGAYGFGYDTIEGRHERSPQHGNVVIEDNVEIGANSTIDRGTYGPTRIGCGTKIDNLVMVAHNCRIGRHNLLCSQVGIAGSSTTGDYVVLAGQVGVKDHIGIGDCARIGAQAGVMNPVPQGETWFGSPATSERLQRQILATQFKLPEMRKALRQIQRRLDSIEALEAEGTQVTEVQQDDGPEEAPEARSEAA